MEYQTTIDDLPCEMLLMVFSCLHILDLPNCRLVSKKWRSSVDLVRPDELVFEEINYFVRPLVGNEKWFGLNGQLINTRNKSTVRFPTRPFSTFPLSLKGLKRLFFNSFVHLTQYDLKSFLDRCERLECLEIYYLTNKDERRTPFELKLPATLKNLHLRYLVWIDLIIDARGLQRLSCTHLDQIKLLYPETLEHYETSFLDYKSMGWMSLRLQSFAYRWNNEMIDRILSEFPNLRRIKWPKFDIAIHNQAWDLQTLNSNMNLLIKQRSRQHKDHIEIFVGDKQLIGDQKFENYKLF